MVVTVFGYSRNRSLLDEFQYFGSDAASLSHVASELNAVWEQRRPPRALVLVLSGSSMACWSR